MRLFHPIPTDDVGELREEVARLKEAISDLEARLELENDPTEADLWNAWPYSWLITGAEKARECFHSFHEKQGQRELKAYNRRQHKQFTGEAAGELTLF